MLKKSIQFLPVIVQKAIFKATYLLLSIFFHHYKDANKKDIFLFSTRRGGSTLLGQIISANKGVRNIDQPLTLYSPPGIGGLLRAEIVEKFLPKNKYSQYASVSPKEQDMIVNFIQLISDGALSLSLWLEYKASRKKQFFFTDRVMLKFTDCNAIIDWMTEQFKVHVIYLIRHPVANAKSIMKNNWTITASAYLDDEYFCKSYLTDEQVAFGRDILLSGDYFQQAILNWCLENLVPLNFSSHKYLTLTYEELVICPDEVISLISDKFDLTDKKRMLEVSRIPSYSTTLSENSTIKNIVNEIKPGDKYKNIINRWHSKITDKEASQVTQILNVFGIDIYTCKSSIPKSQYLHYPSSFLGKIKSCKVDEK